MRINRFLAQGGLGSRRSVESFIDQGIVSVNGVVTKDLAQKIDIQNDTVEIDHDGQKQRVVLQSVCLVFVLFKPAGFICSRTDPKNQNPSVYNLLPSKYSHLNSVGRLDVATSGLLLFTNDGVLLHRLTHPSYEMKRRYNVRLQKSFRPTDLQILDRGIIIDGRKTSPPKIEYVSDSGREVILELKEGRNREIRRIFAATGNEVLELQRISFAGITLRGLVQGKGRLLYADEIQSLKKMVNLT